MALTIASLAFAGACSSPEPRPAPPAPAAPVVQDPAPRPIPEPQIDESRIAPIAPAFTEGLEVAWWITRDDTGAVPARLARHVASGEALPPDLRARWERAGLRVLALEESEVHDLLQDLPPVGMVRRDWIGRKTRWTECFRPPAEARAEPRRIVGLPHPVRPERLRFIARAWSAPSTPPDAARRPVLRVDLALQRHAPARTVPRVTLDEPGLPVAEREGEIFSDVTAEFALRAGQVLLITGEAPGVLWSAEGDAPPQEESDAVPAERFDPAVAPPRPGDTAYGPRVEPPTTPGQAMLTAETSAVFPAPTRTIILLIPRVPDQFTLLPQ